jgi:transposase
MQMIKFMAELQEVVYAEGASALARKKSLCVLMKGAGVGMDEIEKVTGASVRSIYSYQKEYEETGINGITEDRRYKPLSDLMECKDAITAEFSASPPATASEASERINEMCGIKRSPTQVRKFMHDLGLKPLTAGHIPAKADVEEQKQFHDKELQPRIAEAKENKRAILFLDAAHMVWQVYLGVLWCFVRQFIPAASGRVRVNVLGAYDPIKNELLRIINKTYVTATTVIDMLNLIRAKYAGCVTVVLDNARYQKCKDVMAKAGELGIELLYLPTYSPNLNLIERLWRHVKKECLYSKYYDTSAKFEQAITECLDSVSDSKKLKKLMTLKFQLFDDKPLLKAVA